jgi:hypothetical protein
MKTRKSSREGANGSDHARGGDGSVAVPASAGAMSQADGPPDPCPDGLDSPVPDLVARVYAESPARVRSKLITCLLRALGPLSMAALAQGSFSLFLLRASSNALFVTAEEARRITETQVLELARYVAQACPAVFVQVAQLLQAENPEFARTLTGGLLLVAISAYAKARERFPARGVR